MNKGLFYFFNSAALLCFAICITSCSGIKNVGYFQDIDSIGSDQVKVTGYTEPTIQPDDILGISIFTIDPNTGSQVNQLASLALQSSNTSGGSSTQPAINGFLVDKNGEIDLSAIGKVKLAGLTTFQAKDVIREKAAKDFKNPSVQVRFANFKVTIMGEVTRPAMYTLPNEKVTVLDALSLAGDLTLYGKRENVLVIREKQGIKEYGRVNLYSANLFNNPYYYLKQNDIVYVEPHKAKSSALNAPTRATIGLILSAITVVVLSISRF